MNIRKLRSEEVIEAKKLDSISFVIPIAADEKKAGAYTADHWGCFGDGGQLCAALENHDLPIWFDGGIASSRGVASVASDPVSRGQGHVRALMEHVLKDDRENGALFSALYPFSHPFYRKFGYEICFEHRKAKFPTKALEDYRTEDPPKARMILPKDGIDALYPLYTAYAKRYNLAVARDARTWRRIDLGDPYKTEKYVYVLSRDGEDTAYAIFNFRQEEKPFVRTLCLTDYAFVSARAFEDLMSFLYRYAAQAKAVELTVPDNLPLSSLLPEPYDMEIFAGARPMARVLHVERVLGAMRHPLADGAYSVYVEDDFLPENTGCYRVTYAKDGSVSVTPGKGVADLSLSVQTFTQLALGFIGLQEAAFKPDVEIRGSEALLHQVFIKKPVFLWDFY